MKRSLDELRRVARSGENVMPATIDLAHAGGTTGEWAGVLREEFGEYRAPTGVAAAAGMAGGLDGLRAVAERSKAMAGGPPRFLVAKPGLDGHSNGAEQIAVAARDAGMEVVYQGIRLTPEQIAAVARDEDVDVIGLSILSGSHLELVPDVVRLVRDAGVTAPIVVGGIIPEDDRPRLSDAGVAAVYTPKDFELGQIMADIADLVESTARADRRGTSRFAESSRPARRARTARARHAVGADKSRSGREFRPARARTAQQNAAVSPRRRGRRGLGRCRRRGGGRPSGGAGVPTAGRPGPASARRRRRRRGRGRRSAGRRREPAMS